MVLVFGSSTPLTALAAAQSSRPANAVAAAPATTPSSWQAATRAHTTVPAASRDFADLAGPGESDAKALPLAVPVVPLAARVIDRGPQDAWASFDGNDRTQLRTGRGETTRLELDFAEATGINELTLQGPARGQLRVLVETAWGPKPVVGLTDLAVDLAAGQIQRFSAQEPLAGSRVVVEWSSADGSSPVELGFWSYRAPSRIYQQTELADQILAGTLPGALATSANPESAAVGTMSRAEFEFVLQQSPRAIGRAFLVYELVGASHWTGVTRSINGGQPQGGFAPRWGTGGGIQVEEISPAWLQTGVNRVRFERTPGPNAVIRNVRLVSVATGGFVASLPVAQRFGETVKETEPSQALRFDALSQPHYLTFQLTSSGSGRLEISTPSPKRASRLNIELDGLGAGWHRYPLDRVLAPTNGLEINYRASASGHVQERTNSRRQVVSDIAVAASRISSEVLPRLAVSYPLHGECVEGRAYVRGFVAGQGDLSQVTLTGAEVLRSSVAQDGSYAFEAKPNHDGTKPWSVNVSARLDSGKTVSQKVAIAPCVAASLASDSLPRTDEGAPYGDWIQPDKASTLTYAGVTLRIPAGAVTETTRITVRPLVHEQVTQMNRAMVNVTPGGRAYRFGPHGLKFKKPIAVEIPYDKLTVPPGYQEGNIATHYFDEERREWVKVGRLDTPKDGRLASLTDHFTDFVNATIAMPDSPGMKSFNPNELKGMKLASPSAGVTLIQPPEPNAHGSANLEYPLELPPGRNDVQPSLAVTYNSQGDSSWLGMGWDLELSRISIDTRFGVPRYDGSEEFALDGQKIVPVSAGSAFYRRRVEGPFDRIEHVTSGGQDRWVVTSKSGTTFYYGETANARLADPSSAAHVFEWRLDRVVDRFGNEMSLVYRHDQSTFGAQPFDFVYPQRIDYTSNVGAGISSSYAVEFHLDDTNAADQWRKDVKVDGRAGFLTVQRYRLDHVDVTYDSQLIRRYRFAYKQGDFQKSLLESIAHQGRDGEELYRHAMQYFDGQKTGTDGSGSPIYDLFDDAVAWGTAQNATGTPRSEHGIGRNEGNLKGISGEVGVGIGPISITAGGGGNDGDDKTILRFLDLNGDGLPDSLDQSGRASINLLGRPAGDHLQFLSTSVGDRRLGFSDQDGWSVQGNINLAGIVGGTASYSRTGTEDENTVADINGDGLVDLLRIDDGNVLVRLNNRNNGFLSEQSWGSLSANDVLNTRADRSSQAAARVHLIDPLMRWVAPFAGIVDVSGAVQRLAVGGDGVGVQLFQNNALVWSRVIGATDTSACSPGSGNSCSGDLALSVSAGDRVFAKTSAVNDTKNDAVVWGPTFTYRKTASELAMLEPYGRPMYRFSQSDDFRVAGMPTPRWVASANGTVHVFGSLAKLTTSDDLRIRVVRTRAGVETELLTPAPTLSGGATASVPMDLSLPVQAGDDLRFQIESTVQVDPQRVLWNPRVEYTEYCRVSPDTGSDVCGAVTCFTNADGRNVCSIVNDPVPDIPIPEEVLKQDALPGYSTFEWLPRVETATFAAPGATISLGGTLTKPPASSAVVLVQAVNRLVYKQVIATGTSSTTISATGTATPGEQLFITVLTDQASAPSVAFSPVVNGAAVQANIRYADPAFGIDPLTSLPVDGMAGGFHHWYFGDWNGNVPFNAADVHYNDPTLGDPNFVFAAPVYFDIATGSRVPAWVGRGDGAYIAAGRINPARLGSLVPGLGASGSLKALRLAETWNFSLTATVANISGSVSYGDTVTEVDLVDLNGDRYPDSAYTDGVRYNTRGGFGGKEASNLGFGDLRRVEHRNASFKAGFTKELINKTDAKGNTKALVQTGFSVGVDYGLSATHVDLVDINGDGLVDHVKQDPDSGSLKVRLNLGHGFTEEVSWGGQLWHKQGIDPGSGAGGAIQEFIGSFVTQTFGQDVRSNVVRLQDNGNNSVGAGIDVGAFGGGGGVTYGINRTYVDLIDLTGDGLPEHVFRDAGSNDLYVKLNLGDHFSAPVKWHIPSWGSIDVGPSSWAVLGDADALAFGRNRSYSGSVSFKVCFILCVGASGFWSENRSDSNMAFDDIDGDGNIDQVLKQDGDATVYVKKNRLQKTNLLRKVVRPLGGEFELDYTRQGNLVDRSDLSTVVDMPNNQWAVTSVVSRDGAGNSYAHGYQYHQSGYYDRIERENYGFARVTTTREDGSTVETAFHNQDYYRKGLPKSTYERDAAGLLYTGEVHSYREPGSSLPSYTGSFFPGESERRSRFYEGLTSDPAAFGKETHETRTYDVDLGEAELGNLRFYRTYGEESTSADDVIYEVGYDIRTDGLVRANHVVGRDVSGNVLRERQSSYDSSGAMTSLTNVVTGGRNAAGVPYASVPATHTFTYDSAGNLATVTDPNNYTTTYAYDPQTLTYKTSATDSFGYVSSSSPNYYFGTVASVTDTNGQQVQYDYDGFGRLTRVWGPTDLGSAEPTLAFDYQLQPGYVAPGSGTFQPVWARTRHKDAAIGDGDPLVTVTFVDGLDRVIQTKKDLERDNGTDTVVGMSVSGRIEFDARGRLQRQGQPIFQSLTVPSHLSGGEATTYTDTGFVRPTQFSHDVLGRTLAVQTPDGHQMTSTYGFADLDSRTWFVTTVADANGKRRLSYTDVDERVGAVQEFNTLGAGGLQTLTTRYSYNPMNELLRVTDALGNATTAEYDSVGRMVALNSPDMGRTEWGYDLVGNLVSKETARLRALGQKVRYEYEFNRLARIDYPGSQTDVTYEYGEPHEAGSAAGNLAGRVKREVNEAGWRRFYYDELGNIATRESSFERMREPHLGPYVESVSYKYDAFGRALQIRFPGSNHEVVAYGYDRGGLVTSAFGLNTTINAQHPDESPNTIYFEHIGYDEFEQRVRTIHGNGLETTFQYDPNTRRLSHIDAAHKDPALRAAGRPARPFQDLRYDFDAVGNILQANNVAPYDEQMNASVLVGTVNQSFTYDDLYQLKTATGLYQNRHDWRWGYTYSQSYDAIGNITQKVQDSYREKYENGHYVFDHNEILQSFRNEYEYNSGRPHAASRVNEFVPPETQARVIDLTYDASGNQTRRLYRNSEPRTITWDADDRVKVVNLNGQDMSIMRYDGAGERAVHLHHVSGLEETAYMDQHLTIRDGRYHTKHIFAGETRMASKMDPDWFQYPPTLYYHPDHLGSTNFVSNDEQTLTQHDEYFPSGERWWDETDSRYELYKSYIFSGKELDQAIGLYYYGARYYDARQGQWISPDPIIARYLGGIGNGGVLNPRNLSVYTQSYNNPVRYRDPNGQIPLDTIWDAANVIYDIGKIGVGYATGNSAMMVDGSKDLAMDSAAMLIPYVPAGSGKVLKVVFKYGDEAKDSVKAFDKANDARKAAEASAETAKAAKAAQAKANKAAGDAFEQKVKDQASKELDDVAGQLTIKTDSGVKTKIDVAGKAKGSGAVKLQEAKSSATAPLTKNQKAAFPEIEKSGGTVVGKGKPGFPGGSRVPPTKVEIVRPKEP